jgi:hypothetical protein
MKHLILIGAVMLGSLILTACQGTNSTSTANNAVACAYNPTTLTYTNSSGQVCSPTGTTTTCNPAIPATCTTTGLPPVTGVGGTTGYGYGGCQYWNYQYNVVEAGLYQPVNYVPVYVGSSFYCVDMNQYGVQVPPSYNYQQPLYAQQCAYGDYSCNQGYNSGGTCGLGQQFGDNYGYSGISFSISF